MSNQRIEIDEGPEPMLLRDLEPGPFKCINDTQRTYIKLNIQPQGAMDDCLLVYCLETNRLVDIAEGGSVFPIKLKVEIKTL